jgi:hypothetical protein
VTDFVPISVSNVQMSESAPLFAGGNRNNSVAGYLEPGETFQYCFSRIDSDTGEKFTLGNWASFVFALNAKSQVLINAFFIIFSNDCNVFPLISAGDQMGWLTVIDVQQPGADECTAAGSGRKLSLAP